MKWNWGTGIAIFYTCFVIIMVGMVVKSTQIKVNLVDENYYLQDMGYQEIKNKKTNGNRVDVQIVLVKQAGVRCLSIQLPASYSDAEGRVTFFRPSDYLLDKEFALDLNDEGLALIPIESLRRGLWKISLEYYHLGTPYLIEKSMNL